LAPPSPPPSSPPTDGIHPLVVVLILTLSVAAVAACGHGLYTRVEMRTITRDDEIEIESVATSGLRV
jgi:hypothetical protein